MWPLCFHFKLDPGAQILVAGAYKGRVIQLLADMYPHYGVIYGLDPQEWAIDQAQMRLSGYRDIKLFQFGIGAKHGRFPMGEWETDACSFVNIGENARIPGEGDLVLAEAIFEKFGFIDHGLDLAVFNMEGYEFELLPYLVEKDLMRHVEHLAVQFHPQFVPDGDISGISDMISKTHRFVINNIPQWGYWVRNT